MRRPTYLIHHTRADECNRIRTYKPHSWQRANEPHLQLLSAPIIEASECDDTILITPLEVRIAKGIEARRVDLSKIWGLIISSEPVTGHTTLSNA